jgi:AraC family transcriptional regulator|uniref:helix-turn-helix transcriptional regulator n=2 Tax=Cephaloticoccus sp. TaxID=1985742 RepID=UPI00404B0D0E
MDSLRKGMDKIGITRQRLLSQQVTGTRYFFLNLTPHGGGQLRPALGGREHCNPEYAVDRDDYAYEGLEYVAEGTGWVELDGVQHPLAPGTVFAYGKKTRCVIRTNPNQPMVKYFVCLAGTGAAARLQRAGVRPGEMRVLAVHAEMRGLFEDLIHEGQRPGKLARALAATRLELLLLKVEEHIAHGPRQDDPARERFLRCKSMIDERAQKLTTLEDVAAAVGLEVSSVCRLFRRFHDRSPYRYLLQRKMTLAAEDLVENGGLVKEVAQRVGFSDPFHFSRCFKAVHGVAPRDLLRYRRTE